MTTLTLKMLSQHLTTIPHRERYRSLTAWLIRYLRQSQMDIPSHLQDIITHGCVSGVIPNLIYNEDCLRFYNRSQEQIWEKIFDYIDTTGENFG